MKISISRDISGNRGLQNFTRKLIESMEKNHGIRHVKANRKSDIHLILINGERKSGSKNVIRIDGVYYDQGRMKSNNSIRNSMNKSNGVIYQSNWAKKFATGMLGIDPKPSTAIHNGVDQSVYDSTEIDKQGFDKIFLACSHWRPNKRPEAIVDAFLMAKEKSGQNIGLFFIGNHEPHRHDPSVIYMGQVKNHHLASIYKSADYMVHICHLDACPNSVVEGLSAGLPCLSNNIGGTPELTGKDGIILPIDKEFDFKPIKNMRTVDSSSVDLDILSNGMLDMMKKDWNVKRPDLDISQSAKQYFDFFNQVLG